LTGAYPIAIDFSAFPDDPASQLDFNKKVLEELKAYASFLQGKEKELEEREKDLQGSAKSK